MMKCANPKCGNDTLGKTYCSYHCYNRVYYINSTKKYYVKKSKLIKCLNPDCEQEFMQTRSDQKYCSLTCTKHGHYVFNKDRHTKQCIEWRKRNPDKVLASAAKTRSKKEYKQKEKKRREKNKDIMKVYHKVHYDNNKAIYNIKAREWAMNNPEARDKSFIKHYLKTKMGDDVPKELINEWFLVKKIKKIINEKQREIHP